MTKSIQQYIQYVPDGTGRDGYINFNSGGFSRFIPKQVIPVCYEIIKPSVRNTIRDISKTSWTFKYKSDGSGRDSYILQGSGGLQRDYREAKGFGDTLRKGFYDIKDIKLKNKSDNSMSNKMVKYRFVSKNEYFHSARLRKIQTEVTKRLYKLPGLDLNKEVKQINKNEKEKAMPVIKKEGISNHHFVSKSESNLKCLMNNDKKIENEEKKESHVNTVKVDFKTTHDDMKNDKMIKYHKELKDYNNKHKKNSFNYIFDYQK